MLLHDNHPTFSVKLRVVVVFHYYQPKCKYSLFCVKCIFTMADRDKTLIEDGNLSNNNRKSSAPCIVPHSSGAVPPDATHPTTHHAAASESSALKRKQTSFQITSVTVKGSRLSTDGGEDSADDLDESHTEDVSAAEVLESSSKTVDKDHVGERRALADEPPSEPVKDVREEQQYPCEVSSKSDPQPIAPPVGNPPNLPDQWQHRFRVVKIVSSEPFKRGRWLCMDFMDPPAPAVESKPEVLETTSCSGMPVISNNISDAIPADRVAHIYEISPSDAYPGSISVAVGPDQYQQPMYGIFLPINNGQYPFISGINTIAVQRQIKYTDTSSAASSVTTSMHPAIQQSQVFSSDHMSSSEAHSQYSQQGQPPAAVVSQMSVPSVGMVQVSQPPAGSRQTPPSTLQQSGGSSVASSYPEKTSPPATNLTGQPVPMMPQQHSESLASMQSRAQVTSHLSSVQTSQAMPVNVSCASNVLMASSNLPVICSTSQANEISHIASSIPVQQVSSGGVPQTSSVGTQATTKVPQMAADNSAMLLEHQLAVPSQIPGNPDDIKELGSPPSGSQHLQLNVQSMQSNFQPLQTISQPNQAKVSQTAAPVHQPNQSLPHPTQSIYQSNFPMHQSQPVQSVSQLSQSVPQPTQSVQQPVMNVHQPSQAMQQQSSQSLQQPPQPSQSVPQHPHAPQQFTQSQATQQPIQSMPQHSIQPPQIQAVPTQHSQAMSKPIQSLPQHSQAMSQPVQSIPQHSQAKSQPIQSIPLPAQTQAMQQPIPQQSQAMPQPVQSVPQHSQTMQQPVQQSMPQHSPAVQQPVHQSMQQHSPVVQQPVQQSMPQHSQAMQQPVQSMPQHSQAVQQPVQSLPQHSQTMQQPVQSLPQHSQTMQQPVQSIPQAVPTQTMQQPTPQHSQSMPQPMQQPNQAVQQQTSAQQPQAMQPVSQSMSPAGQPIPQSAQINVGVQPSQGSLQASQGNPAQAQEAPPEVAPVKSDVNGEDAESAPSGSSTVAIDNKIEQAMDLVKSHLMFAVREEVDVLKEKITELMDRISQLEYENGFLKANASQQTLEQLNQTQLLQQQQQLSQPSVSVNSLQVTPPQTTQQQLNMQNTQSTS